ncbi:MAG TPA: DUF1254 domain-containing protein [Solirubrobacterales bacterium]
MGAALALAAPTAANAAAGTAPTAAQAEVLGKQAYEYGFPLLEFLRVRREMTSVRCPDGRGDAPVNSFSNAKGFANASARTVVAPNTDTLYSIAHLDLGKGPIVLSHPRLGKRYYSFELLDPYTNVIDIPGLREDGGAAGSYLIRWTKKPAKGKRAGADRVITSKYRRVWVIGRTLATGAKDQRKAHKLMARYRLKRLNGKSRKFRRGCKPGEPAKYPTPTTGPEFIRDLNAALAKNPPPKRDGPLLAQLRPLGIGPRLSPETAGLAPDVLAALYKGVADEAAALPGNSRATVFREALKTAGWLLPQPNIGNYGTDYAFRALIALVGLGANTPDEAIYPSGIADAAGALYNGAHSYRLTFPAGQQPPARYFWSLTMYDANGYLVANPINRYSVGPSHPPLVRRGDGSIVIAMQQTPPAETDVNWLPSPPGGFRLSLRLYGPSKAAQTGLWRPPGVVKTG